MYYIKLTKDNGFVSRRVCTDPWVSILKTSGIVRHFKSNFEIDEGVTLGDFMNALWPVYDTINYALSSELGGFDVSLYIKDCLMGVEYVDDGEIDNLEVYWGMEIYPSMEDSTIEEYTEYVGFHGYHSDDPQLTYSMSLSPLYKFKDKPLKVNKEYRVQRMSNDGCEILFDGIREFTMYQFLCGVLNDISFYGSPDIRDKTSKENKIDSSEIKKYKSYSSIEDMLSGVEDIEYEEIEDVPQVLDEMLLTSEIDRLRVKLKQCKENERYEACASIRDRITYLSEKIR